MKRSGRFISCIVYRSTVKMSNSTSVAADGITAEFVSSQISAQRVHEFKQTMLPVTLEAMSLGNNLVTGLQCTRQLHSSSNFVQNQTCIQNSFSIASNYSKRRKSDASSSRSSDMGGERKDQKLSSQSRSLSEPKLVREVSQADLMALKREAARVKLQRRRWWNADGYKDKLSSAGEQSSLVTVATYNVLAQNLLEDNKWLYRDCTGESVLNWESRKHRLLHDMKQCDFDILCLQEVNQQHFDEFFVPELSKLGFKGVYQKRTGDKSDGCATFYKSSQFELEQCSAVEYYRQGVPRLDRDNVAIILLLRPVGTKAKSARLCVANTHLLYNTRRGDIKLAQLMILLAEIDKLSKRQTDNAGGVKRCPVVVCGDFNMAPFCDLYKLVVEGELHYEGLLTRVMSGQEIQGGRDVFLPRDIVPDSLCISDRCQFVDRVPLSSPAVNDRLESEATTAVETAAVGSAALESGEFGNINGSQWPADQPRSTGTLSHALNLVSSYKHGHYRASKWYREVTTKNRSSNDTVDYIFYSVGGKRTSWHGGRLHVDNVAEQQLQLLATLELLRDHEMWNLGSLPNDLNGSDHLLLAAKFLLKAEDQ